MIPDDRTEFSEVLINEAEFQLKVKKKKEKYERGHYNKRSKYLSYFWTRATRSNFFVPVTKYTKSQTKKKRRYAK